MEIETLAQHIFELFDNQAYKNKKEASKAAEIVINEIFSDTSKPLLKTANKL